MLYFIEVLRAIATLLITNSHFGSVYPVNIAFGGSLGVNLFFMITGFLLYKTINEKTRFGRWYLKKVIVILVPMTIMNLIHVLLRFWRCESVSDAVSIFLFPINTNYWFIAALLLMYPIYYLYKKYYKGRPALILLILSALYVICYVMEDNHRTLFVESNFEFRIICGLISMVIGGFIYSRQELLKKKIVHSYTILSVLAVFITLGCYLMTKLIMRVNVHTYFLQPLTQISAIIFSVSCFFTLINCEVMFARNKRQLGILLFISKYSLQIYLVQFVMIHYLCNIVFPLNMILIICAILLSAICLRFVSSKLTNKLVSLIKA